jgi:hypothetical protein
MKQKEGNGALRRREKIMSEAILAFLKEHRPEFVAEKEAYLRENIEKISARLAGQSLTAQSMHVVIDRLDEENPLTLAAEYDSAWNQHILYHEDKSGFAFRKECLNKMRTAEKRKSYVHEYNELIKFLGEDLRGHQIADLRELAAVKRENNRRKALPSEQLRELSRQENPRPDREQLPWHYTVRATGKQIELTAEVLSTAGRQNSQLPIWDFKYLNTRYPGQINARMNPAPEKKQYKPLPANVTGADVVRAMRGPAARIWLRDYGPDALNNKLFGRS